jgi:hypothetical protein
MTTENWGFLRGLSGLGLIAVFLLMGAHVLFLDPVAEFSWAVNLSSIGREVMRSAVRFQLTINFWMFRVTR